MDDITRIPPHSVEAEQSVLGSMLLDKDVVNIASKKLDPTNFYKEYNRIIFESMVELSEENKPIDLITVTEQLKSNGYLDSIGMSYITSLSTIVPTTSNAEYYINIILEKYYMREAIRLSNDIIDKLYNNKPKAIDEDIKNLKRVMSNNKKIENMYIDASTIKRNKEVKKVIKTGFSKLDSFVGGGLQYGTLSIFTGEPSSGKSTILNQVIASTIKDGNRAFIYSGELPTYQLMEWFVRTVANEYHLEEKNSKTGDVYRFASDYCWELIQEWIRDKFFIFGQDAKATENNLSSTIEHLYIKKNVKLFILDNLMTIQSGSGKEKYAKQEELVNSLKNLAKKYGLVVILVAHPNKESSKNLTHSMYDVAGASEVVNLADHVFKIIREVDEEKGKDETAISILKNRTTGKQGAGFRIYFDDNRKRFKTLANEPYVDYGYDTNKQFVQVDIESPF